MQSVALPHFSAVSSLSRHASGVGLWTRSSEFDGDIHIIMLNALLNSASAIIRSKFKSWRFSSSSILHFTSSWHRHRYDFCWNLKCLALHVLIFLWKEILPVVKMSFFTVYTSRNPRHEIQLECLSLLQLAVCCMRACLGLMYVPISSQCSKNLSLHRLDESTNAINYIAFVGCKSNGERNCFDYSRD